MAGLTAMARPDHHLSGPRLPSRGPVRVHDCFRCAEDRRVLRDYALIRHGKIIGSIQLCDGCVAAVTPLDPDPLDATRHA